MNKNGQDASDRVWYVYVYTNIYIFFKLVFFTDRTEVGYPPSQLERHRDHILALPSVLNFCGAGFRIAP